jgi:hypothetical protein
VCRYALARAAAFSVATQAKVSHPLLRSLDVAELLGGVPILRDGPVSVGRSAVHWWGCTRCESSGPTSA